jgi:Flp pilus assembly pilin Flp
MHKRSSAVRHSRYEDGASLVEYGLMLALIAMVALSAVAYFGTSGGGLMGNNADCIGQAVGATTTGTCD